MKKRFYLMASMLLALAACALPGGAAYADSISVQPSELVRVYDGDTFFVSIPSVPAVFGENIGVRIRHIDAPEMRSHCSTDAAKDHERQLADQAKLQLAATLQGASTIELRNTGRDKYFRLLADVYVDGSSVADQLKADGLAVSYEGEARAGWCLDPPTV